MTLITMLVLTTNVLACDKTPLTPSEAFEEADIIFWGSIENLRYLDDPERTKTEPRIIVTFKLFEL